MSENLRMWIEIIFNVSYLIVVWGLVATMAVRRSGLAVESRQQANLVMWAFGLLALGDTGHVGLRVVAYALGGLGGVVNFAGRSVSLVGIGMLTTAVTVTLFYILMLELWRVRFQYQYGWFEYLLLAAGIVRLVMLVLPVNAWNQPTPPQPWSTIRNLPLMVQGLGLAYLMLRDSGRMNDRTFRWMAGMILVSYACYLPVILWANQEPLLGMLMIPKTLAYVAVGLIAYVDLFGQKESKDTDALELA